jgi:hypothetical protein
VIAIFNIVERHTLSASNRSMYKSIMAAVVCMAELDDRNLRTIIGEKKADSSIHSWPIYEVMIKSFSHEMTVAVTPKDKLSVLVQLLQEMTSTNTTSATEAHNKPRGDTYEVNDAEAIPSPEAVAGAAGADDLIRRLADVISAEICLFGGAISWFAECAYMDLMSRGEAWRGGLDGYALTTLMQTLHSLTSL